MNTVGYLLIFIAVILVRAVQRGRVTNLPEDVQDTFVAVLTGDAAKLREVAARTGSGLDAVSVPEGSTGAPSLGSSSGSALIDEMRKLGTAAGNKYVYGATGPSGYDCSGLVWRAMKNLGIYNGPRFTTTTFASIASDFSSKVSSSQPGDIVLWSHAHMGVVTGPDKYYSALSHDKGILETAISNHPGSPEYFRLT